MEKEKVRLAKIAEATRTCQATVDGQPRDFSIFFQRSYKTNGGWMYDIQVRVQRMEYLRSRTVFSRARLRDKFRLYWYRTDLNQCSRRNSSVHSV